MAEFALGQANGLAVRSFTGMDRNGPDYRNGLPELTFICFLEYFSFGF